MSQICSTEFFAAVREILAGLQLDALKVVLHALNTVFQTAPPTHWAAALDASLCFDRMLQVAAAKVREFVRHLNFLRSDLSLTQDSSALIVTKCA